MSDKTTERKFVFAPEKNYNGFNPLTSSTYYTEEILCFCQKKALPVYLEQITDGKYGIPKLADNGSLADCKAYLKALHDKYLIPVINSEIHFMKHGS